MRIIGGTLNYGSGFRIILSRPLTHAEANADREALKSLISISPEAAWSIDSYDCDLYLRIRDTDKGLKPTTCYTVTFKKGFPIQGAPLSLEDDISLSFITPDLPSSFRYASDGNFFPLHAPIWELPVTSVNLESDVDVSLAEAYPNRIVNFLLKSRHSYRYNDNCFRELARKKLALKTPRNKKTAHSLDLEEAGIPRNRPGFYLLTTRFCQKEYSYYSQRYYNDNDSTQRLIVVTDMALFVSVCGPEYAIQVRRLSDPSQPVANVRLEIYSGKEQLLCSGVTDKEGVCRLQKPCLEDKDDWQALLLARNPQDGDIAFLTWEAYDSRAAAAPMSTLFIDRDICRPGEQVQATAALRQREDGTALEGVPLELALLDVSNSEMASQTVQSDACGLAQATFKIPSGALLGNYTIVLRAAGGNSSPVYGRHSFMVSEFTPDQIEGKVEMSLAEKGLRYNGSAAYYFGQPVSQATVKLNLNISWGDYQAPDAYRAYAFGGVAKEKPGQTAQTVQAVTGDDGLFSGEIPLSPTPAEWGNIYNCAQPLRFMLQAEISGNAGTRPIVARAQKDFHFTDYYLGARVLPEEKSADGNVRRISLVALDTEGNPLAMPEGITCRLSRLEWHYLLKEAWDGTCRREWQCVDELIDEFPVEIDEKGEFDLHLPGSDHYTLLFQEADGKRLLCKTDFWHWAGESAIRSPNPLRLDFTLDRKEYLPGQTAQISFVAE
ncbi:MAG: hypothetical protein IK061_06145, partial [Desulfovibrio sp.]|nr:hypothetical protein [Desulfovibrio sp.]